jgi:hypothetical protein
MLIVDGQIHLWGKGTPSPPHRQEPYSAEQAIAAMDQGGMDRALLYMTNLLNLTHNYRRGGSHQILCWREMARQPQFPGNGDYRLS